MSLEGIESALRAELDARYQARETALAASRTIIRACANSIRAAHRGELSRAAELVDEAHDGLARLELATTDQAEVAAAGYVHDCRKEYTEAALFLCALNGTPLPGPAELGIPATPYLHGLADLVGELRRNTLDRLRTGDLPACSLNLSLMDEIYSLLVTMDYPDGLTGGLRRATDAVRGMIEKTRGELTVAHREEELRAALRELRERLGDGGN